MRKTFIYQLVLMSSLVVASCGGVDLGKDSGTIPEEHFENNIIFRTHNERVKEVDTMWWKLYEQNTRRDQLTLYYVLWKMPDVKTALLLPKGESSWQSDTVQIHKHQQTSKQRGRRGVKESFWEHARCRCRGGMEEKTEQFREFHYWLYGLNPIVAKVLLYLWGVYATLVYGAIIKIRAYRRHKTNVE